jgi:hypothetical protein
MGRRSNKSEDTLSILCDNLLQLAKDQHYCEDSLKVYKEVIEIQRENFGDAHPSVAETCGEICDTLHKMAIHHLHQNCSIICCCGVKAAIKVYHEMIETQKEYLGNVEATLVSTICDDLWNRAQDHERAGVRSIFFRKHTLSRGSRYAEAVLGRLTSFCH